jgi:hypothetical protein
MSPVMAHAIVFLGCLIWGVVIWAGTRTEDDRQNEPPIAEGDGGPHEWITQTLSTDH